MVQVLRWIRVVHIAKRLRMALVHVSFAEDINDKMLLIIEWRTHTYFHDTQIPEYCLKIQYNLNVLEVRSIL